MKKIILTLTVLFSLTTLASAQEQLLPEPVGSECEDAHEPLNPNSREARRMLDSEDVDERACAQLRIELYEQQQAGVDIEAEQQLDYLPGTENPGYQQGNFIHLLNLLRQLFGAIL